MSPPRRAPAALSPTSSLSTNSGGHQPAANDQDLHDALSSLLDGPRRAPPSAHAPQAPPPQAPPPPPPRFDALPFQHSGGVGEAGDSGTPLASLLCDEVASPGSAVDDDCSGDGDGDGAGGAGDGDGVLVKIEEDGGDDRPGWRKEEEVEEDRKASRASIDTALDEELALLGGGGALLGDALDVPHPLGALF